MPDLSYWHSKMSVDNSGQKLEVFTYLTIDQAFSDFQWIDFVLWLESNPNMTSRVTRYAAYMF